MGFLGVLVRLVVVAFLYGAVGLFFPVFIAHLAIIGHLPALTLVSFGLFLLSTILFIVFGFGRAVRWTLFLFFLTFAVALGTSLATLEKKYDEENVAALLRNPGFALVTGSTRGIGFEVSKELIASGWTVFLHGRSQAAMKEAASNLPKGPGSAIVVGVGADLSSFADVRAFVKAVLAHPDSKKLSLLLFNAGIGNPPNSDVRSADGFDFITQSNYLSHELMFSLLQPIVSANRGTVVHTSSGVASLVPFLTHSEITDFKKSVNVMDGYGRTKLLQVVGAIVAARKHPELRVVSVHPGSCTSDMAMSGPQATYEGMFPLPLPFIAKSITPIVLRTWFPISYCAKNVLYAAFSKKVKSGDFVTGYEPQRLGEKTFPGLPVNIDEDLIRMTAAQTANALK